MLKIKYFPLFILVSMSTTQSINAAENTQRVANDGMSKTVVWDSDHNSVFAIAKTKRGYCTGTIIAQRWLLTAGHCGADDDVTPSGTIYNDPADHINYASTENIENNGHYIQSYNQISVIGNSYIPDSYALYALGEVTADTKRLDVSLWKLSEKPPIDGFLAISNIQPTNGDIIRMYGFGQSKPTLKYIDQMANHDKNHETKDHWTLFANIDKGHSINGDSGASYINRFGYIVGIHRNTYKNIKVCDKQASCEKYGERGNGFFDTETQNFILRTINAWNAHNMIKHVSLQGKILTIQSLHMSNVNLLNTLTSQGDVNIDYSNIHCFTPDIHNQTAHSIEAVAPYDICEIPLTSSGGKGVILLDKEQKIVVTYSQKIAPPLPTPTPNDEIKGSALGYSWILGMLTIILFRMKNPNISNTIKD